MQDLKCILSLEIHKGVEDYSAGTEAWPIPEICMGRKGLALDQRHDLFFLRIKGCHNLTLFLYNMRYFSHLLVWLFQKEGRYQKKASTATVTITISIILRT